MYRRKTWREKLENPPKGLPKVVLAKNRKQEERFGGKRIFIATPLLVNGLIRKVPRGKLITINQIRKALAREFRADSACPLTTGIFVRISAEAAEENKMSGKTQITPWWRVLKEGGRLNPKLPGGGRIQESRLKGKGHKIENSRVVDFEKRLAKL